MTDKKEEEGTSPALPTLTAPATPSTPGASTPKPSSGPIKLDQPHAGRVSAPKVHITTIGQMQQESYYSLLIYGDSDSGKTYLASTWPEPSRVLVIDTALEENTRTLEDWPEISRAELTSWEQAESLILDLIDNCPFDVVFFDGLTMLQNLFFDRYLEKEGKDLPTRANFAEDYRIWRQAMTRFLIKAKRIPAHKVFTALETYPLEEGKKSSTGRPAVSGQTGDLVRQVCSVVAHIQKVADESQPDGYRREIVPIHDLNFVGRNRGGKLAAREPADLWHIIQRLRGEIPRAGKEERKKQPKPAQGIKVM